MLDGVLELIPGARVGFVGLYRDPKSLQAVEYYFKVPDALEDRLVIAVDPMLAIITGLSDSMSVMMKTARAAKELWIIYCFQYWEN